MKMYFKYIQCKLYFNYKIQITFVKLQKYKIQNTSNIFQLGLSISITCISITIQHF